MSAEPAGGMLEGPRLAASIAERFRESGAAGTRIPFESRVEIVDDGALRFVVRVLAPRLARDRAANTRTTPARSPFLPPYEPTLLAGAVSATRVCLLNKYNVVDRHVLIVTRELEEQEAPLDVEDFDAAWTCLDAIDGLVFYNAGPTAGASQVHKHLQLVPFPLGPGAERFPLDRAIEHALAAGRDHVRELGCRHRLLPLDGGRAADRAERALRIYRTLLSSCGLAVPPAVRASGVAERDAGCRPAPYNLLMTPDWMLVVPRSCGAYREIEVNALGFAGSFVARGEEELATIRASGPLAILRAVGVPAADD